MNLKNTYIIFFKTHILKTVVNHGGGNCTYEYISFRQCIILKWTKNHTLYEHICLHISVFWLDMFTFFAKSFSGKKDNASGRKDLVGKRWTSRPRVYCIVP